MTASGPQLIENERKHEKGGERERQREREERKGRGVDEKGGERGTGES